MPLYCKAEQGHALDIMLAAASIRSMVKEHKVNGQRSIKKKLAAMILQTMDTVVSVEQRRSRSSSGFLKCGHIKYISIVDLFPTVIADQRSLSLEKQRAAPAQTLSFFLLQ